jgi:predicted transcriptional regulator
MTNHLSDNEPLKRSLRDKSSSLVSFMIGYKDLNGIQSYSFGKEAESKILEIVSLLEVSQNIGLISRMNFSIVQDEFIKLISAIKTSPLPETPSVQSHSINQNYFNVGAYKTPAKQTLDSASVSPNSGSKSADANTISSQKKSSRQTIILSIIKKKGEVTIKDVSEVIKNCSEKTIQRELNSLLSSGVVKRTGERRWSKYSLA